MDLDLIEKFLHQHEHYKGITPERITRTRRVLREFEDSLGGVAVEAAGGPELRSYMTAKLDEGLHPNTIRQYRNMIRPFYTWAWREGIVDAETFMRIRDVECPQGASGRTQPNPYSRAELAQFRTDIERVLPLDPPALKKWLRGTIKRWRRIRRHALRLQIEAITHLALDLGLRRNEIYTLALDDLHYDNEYIIVMGKGGKQREVPFTPEAREAVRLWIEFRTLLKPDHDRPWLSCWYDDSKANPMQWRRFKGIVRVVGPYGLHRFRHTCATERLRSGMSLGEVQVLLGHSSLEQTRAYAQIARHDLARAVERTNATFAAAVHPDLREAA